MAGTLVIVIRAIVCGLASAIQFHPYVLRMCEQLEHCDVITLSPYGPRMCDLLGQMTEGSIAFYDVSTLTCSMDVGHVSRLQGMVQISRMPKKEMKTLTTMVPKKTKKTLKPAMTRRSKKIRQKEKKKKTFSSLFGENNQFDNSAAAGTFEGQCMPFGVCTYKNGYCLDRRCACVLGYSYNYSLGQCVEGCTRYGDSFSKYTRSYVFGCNAATLTGVKDGYECMELCRKSTRITCTSAEYLSGTCELCNYTLVDLEGQLYYHSNRDWRTLYFRHCHR